MSQINKVKTGTTGHTIVCIAPGGTGKTFVSNTIIAKTRLQGKIIVPVSSSGISATLLQGGAMTAHSRFNIPTEFDEDDPAATLSWTKSVKELMKSAHAIIWDEFTQQNRKCFEIVDRTLREVCGNDSPWGGKVMIIIGDVRQILPVVRKGNIAQIIDATLMKSDLWKTAEIHELTKNIRVLKLGT